MSEELKISEEKIKGEVTYGVRGIFDILKSQVPPPQFAEKELATASTDRNSKTSYVPDAIRKIYEKLPEDKKKFYSWYGQAYYDRVIDAASNSIESAAKELLLAVKSGLCPNELSDDELAVLRSIYGKAWYLEAGITEDEFTELTKEREENEKKEREALKEHSTEPEREISGTLL